METWTWPFAQLNCTVLFEGQYASYERQYASFRMLNVQGSDSGTISVYYKFDITVGSW